MPVMQIMIEWALELFEAIVSESGVQSGLINA